MKYTILAVSAALCLSSAFGASINGTNLLAGDGDTIVTDNAGNPVAGLVSGFILATSATDIAGLIASNPTVIGSSDLTPAGADGAFSSAFSNVGGGAGEAIFLVLFNSANLADATLFGLIDTGETLDMDGALPDSNNFILAAGAGTPVIGAHNATTVTADWTNAVGASVSGPQFQLAAIPEPSSSLLAGLAGLGLLIRRKRK